MKELHCPRCQKVQPVHVSLTKEHAKNELGEKVTFEVAEYSCAVCQVYLKTVHRPLVR